ncbi:hypothetical protein [Methylocystis echinoides]|uniref:Glycosyltransferase n=1 Tax=Methylocystis echinoides TaxID=29468 RepID=A0A9W6GWW7_9HYPH|nr:hypothetical protein [Methylocystis echinoides]GLI94517.1 hypothetical protein LMG27198_35090 [Methylocystis echinoides]
MRLLFIVPSTGHKTTAGSRIRYDRLAQDGDCFTVSIQSLVELTSDDLSSCDVCILSKTYALESLAIAQALRSMGKTVGIDLFDDYFTQWDDPRLTRFRRWLALACRACDFALCSTPNMRRVIEHYAPDLAIHVLPDPYPEIDPAALAPILADKLARAQRERVIDVLWFGIGSNPFFPVGLQDLVAWSSSLRALAATGLRPQLTILTNRPALRPERLAQLSRLPIDYRIDFWSLDAEKEALAKALVCFLPVNGQSFSRAKSLNRALTAISAGAQVLSPAFPLYAELDPAIYANATELAQDVAEGRCRIRAENATEIARIVAETSAVASLRRDLFDFLSGLVVQKAQRASTQAARKVALIYGLNQDSRRARRKGGWRAVGRLTFRPSRESLRHPHGLPLRAGARRLDHAADETFSGPRSQRQTCAARTKGQAADAQDRQPELAPYGAKANDLARRNPSHRAGNGSLSPSARRGGAPLSRPVSGFHFSLLRDQCLSKRRRRRRASR